MNEKRGQNLYWTQKDYQTFFKSLLRNETLVKTFIKPAYLDP